MTPPQPLLLAVVTVSFLIPYYGIPPYYHGIRPSCAAPPRSAFFFWRRDDPFSSPLARPLTPSATQRLEAHQDHQRDLR